MDSCVLTQARVRALPLPKSGRKIVYDSRVPSFGVRITAAGAKSFILYRRVHGRPQIITLGRFPDISVETARQKAEKFNGQIADGINPMDQRKVDSAELTFGGLFGEYMTRHAREHKRTASADQAIFNLHLARWKSKKISSISRLDVQSLHSRIGKFNGRYSANRVVSLISNIFNLARTWNFFRGENPAVGVKRFREHSRKRFLQPAEMPRFFAALMEYPDQTLRDYFLLSLMTGARKSNVLTMRWDELNLDDGTWEIPVTKNDDPLTVALTPEAITILQARQATSEGEWVLPGRYDGHLRDPKNAWAAILKKAEITDLRIHDLRRTLGSWQAAQGASLTIIGKTLGHKNPAATAIYARLNLDPVRESVGTAVSAMLAAGRQKEPAEVVLLKRVK